MRKEKEEKNNIEIINRLRFAGIQLSRAENINESQDNSKLNGASFVITGTFTSYSREELKEIIENNGGRYMSSISSKTDYLLAGDKVGSTKIKKSKELGVKVLTENEFFDMVGIVPPKKNNIIENTQLDLFKQNE